MKHILITGGLGYIGSHVASLLGNKAIIIDNLSNSKLNHKKFLPLAKVYKSDLNSKILSKIFSIHNIGGVIHLAGLKAVNESIQNPLKYYRKNIISSIDLLDALEKYNIKKLIFSSSATVYGNKNSSPLKEEMDLSAINPYGRTKIIIENMIEDYAKNKTNFHAISLRYFNPLGADNKVGLVEQPLGDPLNLMPILINCFKERKKFKVFGGNYPTKDGTCVRDYIHVKDLAKAHILAFQKLSKIKGHIAINLGLGKGASVLEIIKILESINNQKLNFKISNPRIGDVDISYADNKRSKKILGWNPKYNYYDMVKDAWVASEKKYKKNN